MRWLPPGSAVWLMAHEVRLGWRGMGKRNDGTKTRSDVSKVMLILLGAVAMLFVAVGGIALGFLASRFPLPQTPVVALIVVAAAFVLFTLMLSQTINLSVQALFERGDLDLLLSSPLKPRVVLTVRAVAITVVAAILYLGLVTPFIITASLLGRPEWLGLYVVLIGLGMVASTLGIVITMGLFAAIGPRATRTVAQVLAGLVGGVAFVAGQSWNLMRGGDADEGPGPLNDVLGKVLGSGAFDAGAPLTWPSRALGGDPIALAVVALIAVVGFAAVIFGLAPRFAANATEAVGGKSRVRSPRGADKPFAASLTGIMARKELRLLARDPQLISQVVLRLVYLLPLGFVLFRNVDSGAGVALGGAAVVVMAGQLAGNFAWIVISAEDSPDLLGCAPIDRGAADRAKLIAALIPALSLTAIALAGFAWLAPLAAIVVFLGCLGSAVSSGLIQVWRQKPATRKSFNRNKRGSVLVALAEFLVQALWAGATGLAAAGMIWALLPLTAAVLVTLSMRRSEAERYSFA
jgi:ABC-2 type transport system permease protein